MADNRTEIIIKEIHFWKRNRLLPASYCDFLLALYTNGKSADSPKTFINTYVNRMLAYVRVAGTLSLLPIAFLVIYFTESDFIMQTGILSIFVLGTAITSIYLYKKKSIDFQLTLMTGLLILLLLNVHLISLWFNSSWSVVATVIVHGSFWFIFGRKLGIKFVKLAGIASILMVATFIFLNF